MSVAGCIDGSSGGTIDEVDDEMVLTEGGDGERSDIGGVYNDSQNSIVWEHRFCGFRIDNPWLDMP